MSVIGAAIWTAGKVAVGAIATKVVGKALGSDSAQDDANQAQSQVGEAQVKGAQERLAFEKDIYKEQKEKYERIYGSIETNLGIFYNSLTPEILTATGLEGSAKEFDVAREKIGTFIAQKDLGGEGLEAKLFADVEVKEAESRAEIRKEAPFKVAQEKEEFLRTGKGLPSTVGVSSAMEGITQARVSQATTSTNQAQARANEREADTRSLLSAGAKEFGKAFGGTTV